MSYRPPYGSQPSGNYRVPPGPGGMTNLQGQFTMGTPQQQQQQQSFHMMHQQQPPQQHQPQGQTGGMAPHMYHSQPVAGIYPTPGYGQMVMQQGPFIGQAGIIQPGMMTRGVGQQAGIIPGMGQQNIQGQQNMTPEQLKKYAEKQKKMLEEQKKKEEQERKDRFREEQKRKLKEFSSGGRSSMGSKSLDMGDLLSKSLMTSQTQQNPSMVQAPGIQYQQYGMPVQSVGFIPQGHHPGMTPMQGVVLGARQPQNPPVSDPHSVTHSQSMDDGFSGFQKAAPVTSSGGQTKEDDFGEFLHAPSNSESVVHPVTELKVEPGSQALPSEGDDDSFGDFLGGGPGAPQSAPQSDSDTQKQDPDKKQVEENPFSDPKADPKAMGSSLENMMKQSTDLSESQKQRKRFNQKPSLNEVKDHTTIQHKSVSTFTPSNKSRLWQRESEDLTTLFTLPSAAQGGQQNPMTTVQGGMGQSDVGQPVSLPAFQQHQNPGQLPNWLQNDSSLPMVYHQVLEASTNDGAIQTNLLYPILLLSGLDRPLLGHIWSMVNYTLPGQLVAQELYMGLALIAHAQRGQEVSIAALCSLSEAPIPQLNPAAAQQPASLKSPSTQPHQEGTKIEEEEEEDFAPFQEAPKTAAVTIPRVPTVLPSISKFTESSSKAGKKPATTLTSLVIPSSSASNKTSSSPAYMQDHTPTEGDDDESFDDFKSPPSDSGPAESELDPSPIPTLPGPGLSAGLTSQVKPSAGASHVPVLVPPKGMSTGTFAAIPPPPHGTRPGSSAVRPFGSEEQLRTGTDDFGEFGDFKAAGELSNSALSQKRKDDWGSFAGQQFKHSASESNLQEMNDRYAALRDMGGSLFDSEPLTVNQPTMGPAGTTEDDEFADFQQAGALPVGGTTSINIPGNQGRLFDSVPITDQLHQPSLGFAAFSPPKEGSDWAQTDKQVKDVKASSPHEEEFEGFFSSRTSESNKDVKKHADVAVNDSDDQYSSLAGLHSFVTDKDDEVKDSFFGDFQAISKPQTSSSSASASGSSSKISVVPPSKISVAPPTSGITLFRLTPPPMTSSPPTSEDAPDDDRFSVLRDLSAVDPFDDVSTTPGMDGTGADYYDTQFNAVVPLKVSPKAGLHLDDLNSGDLSRTSPHKLELTLDTPSTTTSKTFPIGSINELDLKNYDLNLTVDSNTNSKGSNDDIRERVDSFGDFTSASTSEHAPSAKDDSTRLVPASGYPPPAPVQSETSFFGDRYSQVAGDSSDEGRHASEWEKCLTKCHEVMSKANSVFNNISSSSVCNEVIGSSAGVDYLTGVIEVYRVACRIITSIQGLGIDNDVLGTLEKDINKIWHNLTAFLQLSSLKPTEGSFVFKTAMLRPEPSNTPQACGVCLLNVDSRSKAFDRSEDSHKLSYGGRQYHATCANLWVNMVDSILPALPLNTLL